MNDYINATHENRRNVVYSKIKRCIKIEFCWYQKRDLIGHTGILLKGDNDPICTFDFGPSLTYYGEKSRNPMIAFNTSAQTFLAASQSPVASGISIEEFDDSISEEKGLIIQVFTYSKRQKAKVKQAIDGLLDQKMGDYTLLANNCREFVKQAEDFLTNFWNDDDEYSEEEDGIDYVYRHDFKRGMQQVETIDGLKVGGAVVGAALVLGGLAYGISKFLEPSSSNQRRNRRSGYD